MVLPTTLGGVILCRSFVTSVSPFVDHWRSMTAPNWGDNQETSDEDLVGSILEEPTTNDGSMAPPAESAQAPQAPPARLYPAPVHSTSVKCQALPCSDDMAFAILCRWSASGIFIELSNRECPAVTVAS